MRLRPSNIIIGLVSRRLVEQYPPALVRWAPVWKQIDDARFVYTRVLPAVQHSTPMWLAVKQATVL